jgi:hypothetical protein
MTAAARKERVHESAARTRAAIYAGPVSRRAIEAAASAAGVVLFVLASSLAAGACSSLPDIHFVDDASAVVPVDGGEGGTDGGIVPNCKRTGSEICNDGIDNDCNGKTDCDDLACRQQGFSCQDIPTSWTAVSFSATARPSCPDGSVSVDLKVVGGDGASATCNCSCNGVGGSCASGSFTVTSSNEATCSTMPTTTTVPLNNATCTALTTSIALASHAMATPPSPPASCALTSALNGALTEGRLCRAQPGSGPMIGGCGQNQTCGGAGTQGLATCITKDGKSACPETFPKRSTAGTDATDSRSCSGCACAAPTPCTGGSVSLFDSSMCKTNGGAFQNAVGITSSCNTLAPSSNFTATFFKSTPPTGGGCGALTNQGTMTGGVSFVDERTVCCR